MTVTAASFKTDFCEFSDISLYRDEDITFWLKYAGLLLNANRWGNILDLATELYVAHNLTIERQAKSAAANGAPPGLATGIISAKSVDSVSISYDTNSAMEQDAGHWNLTTYGQRYWRMMRMFGAGPIQIGIGCLDANSPWNGPMYS